MKMAIKLFSLCFAPIGGISNAVSKHTGSTGSTEMKEKSTLSSLSFFSLDPQTQLSKGDPSKECSQYRKNSLSLQFNQV